MRFELEGKIRYNVSSKLLETFQLRTERAISFKSDGGKVIGILGENGSGKTTILRAILKDSMVVFEGKLVLSHNGKKLRIIYLPQDIMVKDVMKIRDLLGIDEEQESIAFELGIPVDVKTNEVSAGTLRKIHVLKALLQEGDLYIFDEPTNFIDRAAKDSLIEIINQKMNEGKWFIIASNDSEFLKMISTDLIYVYYTGKNESGADFLELKKLEKYGFAINLDLHALAKHYCSYFSENLYRSDRKTKKKEEGGYGAFRIAKKKRKVIKLPGWTLPDEE